MTPPRFIRAKTPRLVTIPMWQPCGCLAIWRDMPFQFSFMPAASWVTLWRISIR